MKNIKTFDTHAEYNAYITGSTKVLPNVSYCKDNDESHITARPKITVTIDVTQTTGVTQVFTSGVANIQAIIIDGVKQNAVQTGYTFSTTGEHTVKFLFKDGIDRILSSMFDCYSSNNVRITSVKMSNGIRKIDNDAFYECELLREIVIPDSVIIIGDNVFYGCSGLTSVTIGSGVTSIGETAFNECTSLTSVTIPNSVTSIGEYAFHECSGLTSVTIPDSVTSIGDGAFEECTSLASVTIGSGVTSIGASGFCNCTKLESIEAYPTTAPTIRASTFRGVKTGGVLSYRSISTGYNVWMGTGNYYLGKYNWTEDIFALPEDSF